MTQNRPKTHKMNNAFVARCSVSKIQKKGSEICIYPKQIFKTHGKIKTKGSRLNSNSDNMNTTAQPHAIKEMKEL